MFKWFGISLVVVVLDQITKFIVESQLAYGQPLPVVPSFNLTLMYNEGAAFSFLSAAGGWQRWFLVSISLAASVLLVFWLRKLKPAHRLLALALALILGGAIGNLIDRVWLGHVIDFIQVYYAGWYFPTFNIADAAISVGAALLIWDSIFGKSQEET